MFRLVKEIQTLSFPSIFNTISPNELVQVAAGGLEGVLNVMAPEELEVA